MKISSKPVIEKAFFFKGSGQRRLLGFLHSPESISKPAGILYCHPFAEEKNMSHPVMVKAARRFAGSGFPVFRFDFSGCGDSEGDLTEVSLADWQQDIDYALEVFFQETGIKRCFLWGLRLGAGLALLHYEKKKEDIAGLILWQPVLNFSLYIKQFLRQAISTQIVRAQDRNTGTGTEDSPQGTGITTVVGYPITQHLLESFQKIDTLPTDVISTDPTFLLSLSMVDHPAIAITKHAEYLGKSNAPVVLQHLTVEPFWDRYWRWECMAPVDATLTWLNNLRL